MPKTLCKQECLDAVRLHDRGYTWQSIADSLYISRKTLWRNLKLEGLTSNKKRNFLKIGGKTKC